MWSILNLDMLYNLINLTCVNDTAIISYWTCYKDFAVSISFQEHLKFGDLLYSQCIVSMHLFKVWKCLKLHFFLHIQRMFKEKFQPCYQHLTGFDSNWLMNTIRCICRVFLAIGFGASTAGRTSSYAPDFAKAKVAAARLFALFDTKGSMNSWSLEGKKLVNNNSTVDNVFHSYHVYSLQRCINVSTDTRRYSFIVVHPQRFLVCAQWSTIICFKFDLIVVISEFKMAAMAGNAPLYK